MLLLIHLARAFFIVKKKNLEIISEIVSVSFTIFFGCKT